MNRRIGRWDDIVVGGGLLGATVARRLVEAGRRVATAERGQAVTSPAGSHVRNTVAMQASPDTYFTDIDQYLDYIDPDAPDSGLPGAFTTSVRGGVGIVWTNNCPRSISGLDRPELPDESEWDTYFSLAERLLDVRTDEFDDSVRQRLVAERLAAVLAEQGREIRRLPSADGAWRGRGSTTSRPPMSSAQRRPKSSGSTDGSSASRCRADEPRRFASTASHIGPTTCSSRPAPSIHPCCSGVRV